MKLFAAFLPSMILFSACSFQSENAPQKTSTNLMNGICIVENTTVYKKADYKSEMITTVFLGDRFKFLGRSGTDGITEYYKVQIQEGTKGWIEKDAVIFNANPAAVLTESVVHSDPSQESPELTMLHPAEFVVIMKKHNNWLKIVSRGKRKIGWVNSKHISTKEADIFIATMAGTDLLDRDGKIIPKELPYFMNLIPEKNAPLAVILNDILEKEVAQAIEESISEYEMGYYTEVMFSEE
jgi:uncharacterized protein YgiM (DUF1202 family)